MKSESHSVMYNSLQSRGLYNPWNSPGQNTGVGSLSLLQGIFPTQGLNPGLPHCRQILYQLSHKGSPRIPEWVAYPFSSGSFWPRNWTGVSCITGRFLTNWAIREAFVYTNIFTHILWKQRKYFLLNCSWNYHKNWTQAENKISRKQKQDRKLSMITMKESQKLKIKSKHTKSLHPEGKKKHLSSLWVKESGQTEIHNIWEKSNEMVRG